MAEYIDREADIKAIEKADCTAIADDADSCKADYLREIIESVPAADVVPVVHGWWNADENCSVCGENSTEGLDATKWDYWLPNYCPHCGAKMDGGANDD